MGGGGGTHIHVFISLTIPELELRNARSVLLFAC